MKQDVIAWIAGIIEGEGYICGRVNRKSGVTVGLCVQVNMTDEDVLRLCQKRTGLGRVNGPYKSNSYRKNWKPNWKWTVGRTKEVMGLLQAIIPWLGKRRKAKALQVMKARQKSLELRSKTRMANGKPITNCCSRGHLFTPENTHWQKSKKGTYRRCKACGREQYHRSKQ